MELSHLQMRNSRLARLCSSSYTVVKWGDLKGFANGDRSEGRKAGEGG